MDQHEETNDPDDKAADAAKAAAAAKDKGSEEASLEETLKAFDKRFTSQLTTLSQSVGRAQSVADKAAKAEPDSDLQAQLDVVTESLNELLTGIDGDALPADIRAKALAAQAASRTQADRRELKKEIVAELQTETESTKTGPSDLEAQLVSMIEGFELSPDNAAFDWTALGRLNSSQGADAVRTEVIKNIRTAEAAAADDDATDQRRDDRKDNAGELPKGGVGEGEGSELHQVLTGSGDLDVKLKALHNAIGRTV